MDNLNILLWHWTPLSGPPDKKSAHFVFRAEDVMRLASGITACLKMPHRITVVSDCPRETFPSHLGYIPLQEYFYLRYMGGCWLRLECFRAGMSDIIGKRVAWIDTDSVVTGNLDPLFDRDEPLVLYKSRSIQGQSWNGSVILFATEQCGYIWDNFDANTAEARIREARNGMKSGPRGTDQAHLHMVCPPDTPHWTATDGIIHWGAGGAFRTIPEHARLVTFPGLTKPDSEKVRRRSPWIKAYWPMAGDFADGELPDIVPWPVTPSVEPPRPGRFKSLLKQRQEARDARRRMLQAPG